MRRGDHLRRIVELRRHRADRSAARGDRLHEHRFDDRRLALEVVVEGAKADLGLVGDLLDPGVLHALAREERARSLHQPSAGLLAPPSVAGKWRIHPL
jgi:hypothetical protein